MPLRPFVLPGDAKIAAELIPPCFQYPENEAWSIQEDEAQNFVDMVNSLRRMWPLLRVVQWLSPSMRDLFLGYLWEEDGKPVGLVNVGRQGSTATWWIGDVAVLPEYRRRGIARKLVEASIDLARERGAQRIVLEVVAGNTPASTLYERLGFVRYGGSVELDYEGKGSLPDCPLPGGYSFEPLTPADWRVRFDLTQRITPAETKQYEPVEEGRFRQPLAVRPLIPLFNAAMGVVNQSHTVRAPGGEIVAMLRASARRRAGGINTINALLDPAHAALAPALMTFLVNSIQEIAPGRSIQFTPPLWQDALIAAAEGVGFARRYETHAMGLAL